MADIFRSAFGIFGATKSDSDFVGQRVDIGSVELRVKKLIAEGENIVLDEFVYLDPFVIIILLLVFRCLWVRIYCSRRVFRKRLCIES